jgi:hypothetical protein
MGVGRAPPGSVAQVERRGASPRCIAAVHRRGARSLQSAAPPHELPLPDEGRTVRGHDAEVRVRAPPARTSFVEARRGEDQYVPDFRDRNAAQLRHDVGAWVVSHCFG